MVSKEVDHPALINIDNHEFDDAANDPDSQSSKAGQLFFQSVVEFKDTFTRHLPKHVRNKVHSITLKVDFNNIPVPVNKSEVQAKLCQSAFDNLNLRPLIYAKFLPLELA